MRRLVVFFDGTWNTPDTGDNVTNVVKLLRATPCSDGEVSQVLFYDKGVGTGEFTDRIVGGASGKGLTENVIDGYRFLGNNYAEGDEIYIFGFSRGAYTARSLAGMLGRAGLLKARHLGSPLLKVIEISRSDLDGESKRKAIAALNLDRHAEVPIECVGVWDTVGSLGIPGDLGRQLYLKPYQFCDVELGTMVNVALHAVAIDEKRSAFAPTLWVSPTGQPLRAGQIVEQVWVPGVHSNVGGSYDDTGLSDIALEWMVRRVQEHTDLLIDDAYLASLWKPRADGVGYESRSAMYQSSKLYPYQRLIKQTIPEGSGFGEWFRRTFKDGDRRNIVPEGLKTVNEVLHVSALERWKLPAVRFDVADERGEPKPYRPVNLEAVIRAQNVPVVDNRGATIPRDRVVWPALS
jgi:uncharacterized protein (DUF2235 family)